MNAQATTLLALEALLKGAALMTIALLVTAALRRASASMRYGVWTATFAGLLALPVLAASLPPLHIPIMPMGPVEQLASSAPPASNRDAALESSARQIDGNENHLGQLANAPMTVGASSTAEQPPTSASRIVTLALSLWLAGAVVLLARLGWGVLSAHRLAAAALPLDDTRWAGSAQRLARQLGLKRQVRIAHTDKISLPMSCGLLRPTVLLPSQARSWSRERRDVVLLHELSHLQRRDCEVQLLARVASALHWFNPLVWVATRRHEAEREHACDDAVLRAGARPSDYAQHLLDVARGAAAGRPALTVATVSMARRSQLEGRLLAVLDPKLDRRSLTAPTSSVALVAALLLTVPIAALQPWSAAAATETALVQMQTDTSQTTKPARTPRTKAQAAPNATTHARTAPKSQADAGEVEQAERAERSSRVVAAMVRVLEEGDPGMRRQAVHALGMSESLAAVPALAAALQRDAVADVRSQAAWALGMIESAEAVDSLSSALSDEEATVRSQAAWALGMIESPDGVDALARAMSDAETDVRSQAAWALAMIESPEGVSALSSALSDGETTVRSQAAWALGMIEDSSAVDALVGMLRGDAESKVRSQAAWALGMIEDASAADALIDAIEDEDKEVREQALRALGRVM